MKISYNWLKDYIKIDAGVNKISEILTDIGLEVDGIEKTESIRGGLEGVLVGEVLECVNHPGSDHLHITKVSIGEGDPLQIVCGAPNVAQGQKVLVATINTTLYPSGAQEGFKIKKSKIRGEESFGMICAEDELGIGSDHGGIMILPAEAVPGTPAKEHLGIEEEYVIEIGLTPNRADAASHYGVARDLAAYFRSKEEKVSLELPSVGEYKTDNTENTIKVEVADGKAAPRYAGITITGIKVGPSPEWLQKRLRSIGLNPKNNIVDITNFVLHEVGQPLHAFDAAKIESSKVIVRTCPEGTPFVTLDGVERKLSEKDLMICDDLKPMCIAGVMGGAGSGVTEETTSVFLESAYFSPVSIRKSAKRHGINSDASFRFERGLDPNITIYALKRAALLIKETAGGLISSEITDIVSIPEILEPFRIELPYERINTLTGKVIPQTTVKKILESLEIQIESEKDGVLSVAVPPYRVDVKKDADLIEDILRIYGYNNIEISEHLNSAISYEKKPSREKIMNMVANSLTANGFTETMNNSLTKAAYYDGLESYKQENLVRILNPLSNDLNVMRRTLLFNMMEVIALNTNHRHPNLKLYEFGNVYSYNPGKVPEGGLAPYSESYRLAMAITGLETIQSWNTAAVPGNFFHLKAAVGNILKRFGHDIDAMQTEGGSGELYSDSLTVKLNGKELLVMGTISPRIKNIFDFKADVWFMEMDFDLLVKSLRKHKITVSDLPKFPEVKRDLALLVNKGVTFSQLRSIAFAAEKRFLKSVSLFDVYEGDKLPEGKKSYALSFTLQDETKTMTDQMIDRIMNNFIARFKSETGAEVRS